MQSDYREQLGNTTDLIKRCGFIGALCLSYLFVIETFLTWLRG